MNLSTDDAAREERAAFYTEKIIKDAKGQILLHMPYLMEAVLHLHAYDSKVLSAPGERSFRFGTNGKSLFYDPFHVYMIWRSEEGALERDLLHSLFHCLFRHPFPDERTALPGNRELWNLSCDVAAEALINELEMGFLYTKRQEKQLALLQLLETEIGKPLSAERIFRWFSGKSFPPEEISAERRHFLGDQHGLWYRSEREETLFPEEIDWEELSRRTELLIEEEEEENPLLAQLQQVRRRKIPYRAFLRRFVNQREMLRTADEFDYVYYHYGLSLYGNIPLIEPLEYREDDRIRTIAVAIDTSGSVQGAAVQSFIEHTCSILLDEALVADRMKIHLIQCDDRIREDVLIRNRGELADYMREMTVQGLGQTDFRPVFTHLGGLIAQGKIKDFQGLLYFTDGQGIFPAKAPSFETAFILSREDAKVPSWAVRYVLE